MTKSMLLVSYIWGVFIKGILVFIGLIMAAYCCYRGVVPSLVSLISSIIMVSLYVYMVVEETICLCELWREVNIKRIR